MLMSYSTPDTSHPPTLLNTCLLGQGIGCGLSVRTQADGSIVLEAGTALLPDGSVLHLSRQLFRSYLLTPAAEVTAYLAEKYPNTKIGVWQLTNAPFDPKTMDSLVPQSVDDEPKQQFLTDKILTVYTNAQGAESATFLLIRTVDLVRMTGLETDVRRLSEPEKGNRAQSVFAKPRTAVYFAPEHIEAALFPYQQLPALALPRFGYRKLAVLDKNKPFGLTNLQQPFSAILAASALTPPTPFGSLFFEYKAILDEGFETFKLALRVLHTQFGPLLTGKHQSPKVVGSARKSACTEPVQDEFAAYREVLCRKWQSFKEEGEQLYYIQYFYDWLADLHKAYDELARALADFAATCNCHDPDPHTKPGHLLRLGPVSTEADQFGPLIFRDYYQEPYSQNHNEEALRHLKCLHWRLLMQIWTFDLPGLHLERKVLINGGYLDEAEEYKESTDYWEMTAVRKDAQGKPVPGPDGNPIFDPNELPVRITPSRPFGELLGLQVIPSYYPVAADSPYSVHRFWDFETTKTRRIDRLVSYNANRQTDSYTDRPEVLFPLAYTLRERPFLRVEGHIGKTIDAPIPAPAQLAEIINKYNLGLEVLLVDIANASPLKLADLLKALNDRNLFGLDHQNGGLGGQTLVLCYTSQAEQLELNECKKDDTPEIAPNTIVADFTLPFLFSTLK